MENNTIENKTTERAADQKGSGDYSHINGWGIDADPTNEPTHPMKKYTGDDHKRLNWDRPPLQKPHVEILHSNERPNLTAVVGTSTPPSGLSGKIRRYAFKHSESTYLHWFPLVIADRVNVVEGIIDDLKKGIVPNIFAEKGWKAEWKYNRAGLIKKVAITAAVIWGTYALLSAKRRLSKG
jgi:hypothetical protein